MLLGKLVNRRSWLLAAMVLAMSMVLVPTAFASGIVEKVGDVQVTMYAPSVVWQATNAHVIIKMENTGTKPVTVDGLLMFPDGKDSQFTYGTKKPNAAPKDGVKKTLKDLKPGESQYIAFTYITPKDNAPLGMYTSNITLSVNGASKVIPWTFDVRTGTVFVAQTSTIVYGIYGISVAMLIFWFVYFKGFVNKKFNILAGEEQ